MEEANNDDQNLQNNNHCQCEIDHEKTDIDTNNHTKSNNNTIAK